MGGNTPSQQITTTNEKGATSSNLNSRIAGSETSSGSTFGSNLGTTFGSNQATRDVNIPDWLKPLITQGTGVAGTTLTNLQDLTNNFQVPQETLDALTSTARGDFLYGGPQQQAFVDAALRTAAPGVISAFGGRATGGLARAALNQQGVDAFANLFSNERANQLAAAQALPGFRAMPIQLQQALLAGASALPGQFAPFLGDTTSGTQYGFNTGTQFGTTSGQSSSQQQQQSSQQGTSKGTTQQIQPLYQTPWWQTALGAGTALAGLAMPGLSGVSALGNIIGGTRGLTRGLLGATR